MKEFLSERDLDERGLFSKPHRERLIKAGKFPKPIQFSLNGKRFYRREDIEALQARRLRKRALHNMTDRETGLAGGSLQARREEVGTSVPSSTSTNGNAQARRKTDDWEPRFKIWLRRQSDERVRQVVRAATAEDEQRRRTSGFFRAERSRHYRPRGLTVGDRVEVMRRMARWP